MKYKIFIKIVNCASSFDLLCRIEEVFVKERGFPEAFCVQFNHKEVDDYVNLDSPIQPVDRADNNLLIIPELNSSLQNNTEIKKREESDKNDAVISDESFHSG